MDSRLVLLTTLAGCGPLAGNWNGELEIIPPGEDDGLVIKRVAAFEDRSNLSLSAEKKNITFDLEIRLQEVTFKEGGITTPFDAPTSVTAVYTGPGGPLTMDDAVVIATTDLTADVPLVNYAKLKLTDDTVFISLEFGCIDDFEKGSNFYDDNGAKCVTVTYEGEVPPAE